MTRPCLLTQVVFATMLLMTFAAKGSAPKHTDEAPASATHVVRFRSRSWPSRAPAWLAPVQGPAASAVTHKVDSTLTFYDCLDQGFCGEMANGEPVYEGAAACSYDLAFGTRFLIPGDPTNRVYVCKDRGLLADTHVDIFWNNPDDGWSWQSVVGSAGEIEILDGLELRSWTDPESSGYVAVAQ
jgi:hypothetical protein